MNHFSMDEDMEEKKIAILASFSGTGGVERMISNLLNGFSAFGVKTDLLLIRADNLHYLDSIPDKVNLIKFKSRHNFTALPELVKFLKTERPHALLAAKDRAIFVAAMAKTITKSKTRIVARLGTTVSEGIREKPLPTRIMRNLIMKLSYRLIDETICVSKGVAEDLANITGLKATRFHIVRNPVITEKLYQLSKETVNHPWLTNKEVPVILGIGRLTRQKDFGTLLKAFHIVQQDIPSRLIILGEGGMRRELTKLIRGLKLKEYVDLPGFTPNPYPYIKNADLFVLSSRWEGSPNALTEALALGVPVASTDCPSGPKEILQNGRFGPLVPPGDYKALAEAMIKVLNSPLPSKIFQQAVAEYTVEESARRYLQILFGEKTTQQ